MTPAPRHHEQQISPFQTVRVLDTSQLAAASMGSRAREHLRALLRELASCRMGQLLLRHAIDQRLVVRFAEGSELLRNGARAAGFYHGRSRTLVLDDRLARDEQLVTLAHELQHFVDDVLDWPLGTIECEVRAQQTEALVIRQLRLRAHTWGLASNGQLRHPEDIAAKVRAHPLYANNRREPPSSDGRVHPLVEASELLPPMVSTSTSAATTGGAMRVGAVAAVVAPNAIAPTGSIGTAAATQAVTSALGAARPTCFDPAPAWVDDTPVGSFMAALDLNRLACGA
ncbi:MAG: hypothetical protein KDC46_06025 [Thermoleophilia bacterium]|nr:hypothetical protein [Thermoleophilia bacterium]